MEQCMAEWGSMWRSRKARYFMSWKREVHSIDGIQDAMHGLAWDAKTVCKCLGKCPIGPFEDLGLIDACAYSRQDQARMQYLLSDDDMAPLF